ncbi:MAG: winged helix-turn-helix domain-containing protein [Actinobacteria bacterium]|nr:winged helix-turn-helix domain-containing protein [Cyanobacteriota bacterium]MCL5771654.1 winged helix-turn-helix domain-containing protein [Actinomycetota bacterium]
MERNEVNSAFEILLGEIENVLDSLNNEGEKSFKSQNYEKAKILSENATKLIAFRDKVKELQKEWKSIFIEKLPVKIKRRKKSKKLQKGLKTNEKEFRIPILETLVELNGEAKMKEALQKVYIKMKDRLNDYDKEPLLSNPNQVRWENSAQWCRNTMVNEGLLSSDSQRGIWKITDLGKQYLLKEKNK